MFHPNLTQEKQIVKVAVISFTSFHSYRLENDIKIIKTQVETQAAGKQRVQVSGTAKF